MGSLFVEAEAVGDRGRLRLQEQVDTVVEPEAPESPAASHGLTRRETEVLVLVAKSVTISGRSPVRMTSSSPKRTTSAE